MRTATEWLISHWIKLDSQYYSGEIGRVDYRNKRDSIQVEAKEMEKDFAIGFAEWIEKYQGATPNLKLLKELLEIYKSTL